MQVSDIKQIQTEHDLRQQLETQGVELSNDLQLRVVKNPSAEDHKQVLSDNLSQLDATQPAFMLYQYGQACFAAYLVGQTMSLLQSQYAVPQAIKEALSSQGYDVNDLGQVNVARASATGFGSYRHDSVDQLVARGTSSTMFSMQTRNVFGNDKGFANARGQAPQSLGEMFKRTHEDADARANVTPAPGLK